VPFDLFASGFCARSAGFQIAEIYSNPMKSFHAQLLTKKRFGHDGDPLYVYASQGAWEMGGEIRFPEREFEQAPVIVRFPITTIEDIEALEIPEISKAGAVPLMKEFSDLQRDNGMMITLPCGTPFKFAANAMDLSAFVRLMLREPARVHQLLRKLTDFCVKLIAYWVNLFGPERILCRDSAPTENNKMISPKQFETFSLPYLVEVHERAFAMGIRRFCTHICGEQNLNLDLWKRVPMGDAGIMSFGHEVDLEKARAMFGDRSIIAGNVEPSKIQFGTADEVYHLCGEAIRKGKDSRMGFILMPGCELPPDSHPQNVLMMKKAVEDFGRY
jgi:uroporphyrinogen decarboxylase